MKQISLERVAELIEEKITDTYNHWIQICNAPSPNLSNHEYMIINDGIANLSLDKIGLEIELRCGSVSICFESINEIIEFEEEESDSRVKIERKDGSLIFLTF